MPYKCVHLRADRRTRADLEFRQIQLLKDAGLVTALGPKAYGGGGLRFDSGYKVGVAADVGRRTLTSCCLQIQRAVAAGDGSIGQLLAYHYLWSYTANAVGTAEQLANEARRYTENNWFIGGAVNPRYACLTAFKAFRAHALR